VGDLVKPVKPYDYWLGIVVEVETVKKKLYKHRPNQEFTTVWVKWTMPIAVANIEPESYWVDDLHVVSKAIPPRAK